jgi:hypothetical protein
MVQNLATLGFPCVYNRREDFYAKIENNAVPDFDVLVTNPPYSGDHMRRLLEFATQCGKPWLLLVPNYVYTLGCYGELVGRDDSIAAGGGAKSHSKASLKRGLSAADQPVFLCPRQRYCYRSKAALRPNISTEAGFDSRDSRKSNHRLKYVAPFYTFWYVGLQQYKSKVVSWWRKREGKKEDGTAATTGGGGESGGSCVLCESLTELPSNARCSTNKDSALAKFRKAFNDCCRSRGLGKLCTEYALTGRCDCTKAAIKSPFSHDPPPAHTAAAASLRELLAAHQPELAAEAEAGPAVGAELLAALVGC